MDFWCLCIKLWISDISCPFGNLNREWFHFSADVDAFATIKGEKVKKEDDVYFHVTSFKFKFTIGHAQVKLDNLFDGDKALGK